MSNLVFKNVREKLVPAEHSYYDRDELELFMELLASVLPTDVSIDEFMDTIELLVHDIKNKRCGFHNNPRTEEKFEDFMEYVNIDNLPVLLTRFPRYIDKVADEEFAREFYQRYGKSILGEEYLELPKKDYGYIEIEDDIIDISNKDKAEVLAGLYNNSHPQGLGVAMYDPTPMSVENARELLEQMQSFDYLKGRPLKIYLGANRVVVAGYNHDNGRGLAQRVVSSCRNINEVGKDKLKKIEKPLEEIIQSQIEQEISKKQKEMIEQQRKAERVTISHSNGGLDHLRVPQSELQPIRRLIEESGLDITGETVEFIKNIENQAYPEEMKVMQDAEDIEDLSDIYGYFESEITIARNRDWYIVYGEDEDSVEILDIASLPTRDREASRREMHNYLVGVINRKAKNGNKPVTLNAKEDTSYRMIQRMVNNGEYEIVEDTVNTWETDDSIIMHNLVLTPILERTQDRDEL